MANPRIDELRKRLEREPGSRLFAQLAEELRKDGDLAEAIRVARAGLVAHPSYPSARMTLGRALFDTKDLAAARGEFESVLRGAPDNILASRMLAECLEGLGDPGAALLQFRAAERLAPGDRQIQGQIRLLEQRLAGSSPGQGRAAAAGVPPQITAPPGPGPSPAPRPATPPLAAAVLHPSPSLPVPAPAPPPASPSAAPPAGLAAPSPAPPDTSSDFDDVFETSPSWQRAAAPPAGASGPILLLDEDEAPTLPGAPYVAPGREPRMPAPEREPTAAAAPVPGPPAPLTMAFEAPPLVGEEATALAGSELGAQTLAAAPAFVVPAPPAPHLLPPPARAEVEPAFEGGVAFPPAPPALETAAPRVEPPVGATAGTEEHRPETPPAAEASDLSSSTLAELYFGQGFLDKALQVYAQLLERDPYDERARARLIEIRAQIAAAAPPAAAPFEGPPPAPIEAPPPPVETPALSDPRAGRRLAIERTITRLEGMLAAVKRA